MPTKKTVTSNVVGYSLKHYAIVQVESKSKKGTKKAMQLAMDTVEKANPSRILLGATFVRNESMGTGDTPCETWAVEYIRPSGDGSHLATQG